LFAAIYTDTPPHVVERVITPFPCSAISPRRSLSPQYDSCSTVDHDDDDDYSAGDADDILSQSSMSPDPPSPKSVATTSQRSSNLVPVTSSHRTMSSDLASRKSNDLSTHGPSCPAPSPYDSNADSCDGNDSDGGGGHTSPQWAMSPGLSSDANHSRRMI